MKGFSSKRRILAAVTVVACLAAPAMAGFTLTTLGVFDGSDGSLPQAGVIVSGGTIYGTTSMGSGNGGTIFSLPIGGGTPTTLVGLNDTGSPEAGLTLSNNTLYGTVYQSTGSSGGAIFGVPITGGLFSPYILLNGTTVSGLTLSGNTLYATNETGGVGEGEVFSVSVAGGPQHTLAVFHGTDGATPEAGLILSGNTLYGTTTYGGTGAGTVFSVPVTGGGQTVLGTFSGSNGSYPEAGLLLVGNMLYGTTTSGGVGANAAGTVFSIPVTGGTPTTLATFNGPNGGNPVAGLTFFDGRLYGTTQTGTGSATGGTVFSLPLTGGTPLTVATFTSFNGFLDAGLTVSGNVLYGTTYYGPGPTNENGTVFSLTPKPVILVSGTTVAGPGLQLGTLQINNGGGTGGTGAAGGYNTASATFAAASTGYLAVSGINSLSDSEVYALNITDSDPDSLDADLVEAASELNAASYSGYDLSASLTDPTGMFGSGYNLFITISGSTLGTYSPNFGFDFTQLNGTSDTLSATGAAVADVPEPATAGLMGLCAAALFSRRRR